MSREAWPGEKFVSESLLYSFLEEMVTPENDFFVDFNKNLSVGLVTHRSFSP